MRPTPVFLSHRSSLAHETGGHPERPERITAIERELEQHDWLGLQRVDSPAADRAQLTAVHPESYVEWIEAAAARGGAQLDLDTVLSPGSFEAAAHGAGGAVALVDLLLQDHSRHGFSAHRPPGHHAGRSRAMGFCLFNNIAIGAQHALDSHGLERVMILDWDVHHGNGTNDIFHASEQVLFVSIHQSPLYPGTGAAADAGTGAGRGFTVNLPMPAGSGDAAFASVVDHVAVPLAAAFAPQLMLISAGYDAHVEDPLAGCRVTEGGFAAMTRSMRCAAAAAGAPIGFVLEGGYALDALARSVAATLEVLCAPLQAADDQAVGLCPEARAARARLAPFWPALA